MSAFFTHAASAAWGKAEPDRPRLKRADGLAQDPSKPYLMVCLPPPLRFGLPQPPRTYSPPPVTGPLHPGGLEADIAASNRDSSLPAIAPPPPPKPVEVVVELKAETPPPTRKSTMLILPDDTPTALRAEDVLPFFVLPGNSNTSDNIVAPPSSATYRQQ